MAQNEMRKLVLGFSLIYAVLISGVAAEAERSFMADCSIKCNMKCLITKKPMCVTECLKNCKFEVLDGLSKCTFSCANSGCMNFISDAKKLEGCVGFCYKHCCHRGC